MIRNRASYYQQKEEKFNKIWIHNNQLRNRGEIEEDICYHPYTLPVPHSFFFFLLKATVAYLLPRRFLGTLENAEREEKKIYYIKEKEIIKDGNEEVDMWTEAASSNKRSNPFDLLIASKIEQQQQQL